MIGIDKKKGTLSKAKSIAVSFLCIILAGAVILMLPVSSATGEWTDFFTALFTATSASCVTGLVVVDTYSHWSLFGQLVILTMIQIGGLGVITMGILVAIFFKQRITLKFRNLLQESINSMQVGGVVRLVRKVIRGVFLFEGMGALILMIYFIPRLGVPRGIYYGIFHSISAFCNAGFDLMGYGGEYSSFVGAVDSGIVNIVFMSLILIGGIGFAVWDDISIKKWHVKEYTFHTKLVLTVSFILVFGGALLFFLFEQNATMVGLSTKGKIYSAFFSSVTARTAGFNTVDTAALSESGRMLTVFLMFIGGCPGSTAGGIKTSTIAVILIYVVTHLKGKRGANIFGRCISDETVKKAITVFMLNLSLAIMAILIICGAQPELHGENIVFEVFSAIGTVGMSTGVTRQLGSISRIVIIILMYLGRIGSMTFALTFSEGRKTPKVRLPLVEEPVG